MYRGLPVGLIKSLLLFWCLRNPLEKTSMRSLGIEELKVDLY
jgi:hypothetical protein